MQDTGAHTVVVVEVGTFPVATLVATSATAAWLSYSWRAANYVVGSSDILSFPFVPMLAPFSAFIIMGYTTP